MNSIVYFLCNVINLYKEVGIMGKFSEADIERQDSRKILQYVQYLEMGDREEVDEEVKMKIVNFLILFSGIYSENDRDMLMRKKLSTLIHIYATFKKQIQSAKETMEVNGPIL